MEFASHVVLPEDISIIKASKLQLDCIASKLSQVSVFGSVSPHRDHISLEEHSV